MLRDQTGVIAHWERIASYVMLVASAVVIVVSVISSIYFLVRGVGTAGA